MFGSAGLNFKLKTVTDWVQLYSTCCFLFCLDHQAAVAFLLMAEIQEGKQLHKLPSISTVSHLLRPD